jgi:trans-aconitate 2-methyltransferase
MALTGKDPMQPVQQKWNAKDYAKNSSAQFQWAQELVSKLALRGCETVLDIGCGDGKISAQLALIAKNGSVLGIDLSEDMIRLASEQFPPSEYPPLSFVCMDAADIRLSEKFDVAFSSAALHWVENHIAVLRGVHACLKSGGRILFQMGGRGNATDVFDAIEKVLELPRWRGYYEGFTPPYHFYGPEEYEAWLPEGGFRPIRVELVPKDMQHNGTQGFKGWLRTTWFPYTDPLPIELHDAFLTDVVETYTALHPIDTLGYTHVKMVRLEVEAYAL